MDTPESWLHLLNWTAKSRSQKMPRIAFVPFVSFLYVIFAVPPLPSFLSNGERKKMITPQVVPAHLFCGLGKAVTSLDLLHHVAWILGAGKRGAVGSGRSWPDWVAMIKHSNQRALQFSLSCLRSHESAASRNLNARITFCSVSIFLSLWR